MLIAGTVQHENDSGNVIIGTLIVVGDNYHTIWLDTTAPAVVAVFMYLR